MRNCEDQSFTILMIYLRFVHKMHNFFYDVFKVNRQFNNCEGSHFKLEINLE